MSASMSVTCNWDPHSPRKLPSHLPFDRAVYLRPTRPHALGDGSLESGLDPLPNHRALELSKGLRFTRKTNLPIGVVTRP